MSTDAFLSLFDPRDAHEPRDPMKAAQAGMRPALPARFYALATVEARDGAYHLLLDGKGARTPARQPLAAQARALAEALAAEWNAQGALIDPAQMPLTRLVNAALDGVAGQAEAVRAEIVRYAGSDLICYRADSPAALAERQAAAWDPLVGFAREALGARLILAEGVMHVPQPEHVRERVAAAVAAIPTPVPLAALSSLTSLTGSAIIALALAHGALNGDAAWSAAHVDEDYQAEIWGLDEEASARQVFRRRDFDAALLALTASAGARA
jgi:chaperone required for assembly of F1-ATPase